MLTVTGIIRYSIVGGFFTGVLLLAGCGSGSDEDEAGTLVLSDDSYTVLENAGALSITVNRLNGSSGVVSVHFATQDDTALAGVDYVAADETLTFIEGETSKQISLTIKDNDIINSDKTFRVELSDPTGGALLSIPNSADVTILDEESIKIYDFESLGLGNIIGQDGWVETVANATIVNDFLVNGTQVVRPNVISGLAGDTELTRVNDVNFNYPAFIRNGEAEIWFDATGDDNAVFSLGWDINNDGFLSADDDEIGVPFGIWERQFSIFTGNSLIVRAGVADLGDGNDPTHWYRMRLRIDFAANSGNGSASFSYMNLSTRDASFTDVPGLQDLNLKLLFNNAPDEAEWDAMFLKLRVDATNIPKVDNLIPNFPINP